MNSTNPESNRFMNSNCLNDNKEEVKELLHRQALLLASAHARSFIFSSDSLLELATQIKFVTRSMQISCSGNY